MWELGKITHTGNRGFFIDGNETQDVYKLEQTVTVPYDGTYRLSAYINNSNWGGIGGKFGIRYEKGDVIKEIQLDTDLQYKHQQILPEFELKQGDNVTVYITNGTYWCNGDDISLAHVEEDVDNLIENLKVKVNGTEISDFDVNKDEYRMLLDKDIVEVPTVSAAIEVTDNDGEEQEIAAEVVQAEKIPDCAIIKIFDRIYRVRFAYDGDWTDISGEEYDAFMKNPNEATPETPYTHDYSQTLTTKLFLAMPNRETGKSDISLLFDEALDILKKVDNVTVGIPKIVYLIGWQYTGHDDKYPSWDEVNPALKCNNCEHENALECLKWLMDEGQKYNTIVSLHINSSDIYTNSPLWEEYVKNDLINKKNGKLDVDSEWSGMTSYRINHAAEWRSGFYKERVDRLCRMLDGRIERAGTIHSDAFQCKTSDQSMISEDQSGRRQMIRYWRSKGVDLTTEFCYSSDQWSTEQEYFQSAEGRTEPNLGLVPMTWHFEQPIDFFMTRPANVLTGSNSWCGDTADFIFGRSMMGKIY